MRALLAVAAVLAVAGCAPGPQAATSTAADASPPAKPTTPSTAARTRAEIAFLAVIAKEFDGDIVEQPYLEDGRRICEMAADSPWEAVQAVIDNRETDAVTHRAALTKLCPKHRAIWTGGATGFGDGEHAVGGKGIRPGTYRTFQRPVTDCYWERSTSSGQIIANQLVTNAPKGLRVTVRSGEGFTTRDCGPWVRA